LLDLATNFATDLATNLATNLATDLAPDLQVEEARVVRKCMLWAWAAGVGSLEEDDMEILIHRRSTWLS
jgi:hypothetical protein